MSDMRLFEGGDLADKRLSMGRVVSQTFGIIGRNLPAVAVVAFVISLLVVALATIAGIVMQQSVQGGDASRAVTIAVGFLILFMTIVVRSVSTGGITHIAISDLNGQTASIGQALATGLRLAFPLLGLSIVIGLGCGLAALLFLIPGIMLGVRWMVAIPARVVEGPPMGSALARSGELTKGSRWRIFFLLVILIVFSVIVTALANGLALSLFAGSGTGGIVGVAILQIVGSTITTSVSATGLATLYAELRRVREGATPSQLAAVFA